MIEDYNKIIDICNKYVEVWESYWSDNPKNYMKNILTIANNQKKILERNKEYWLSIPCSVTINNSYFRIDSERSIMYYKNAQEEKNKWWWKYISWSDDGRQPKNEWLYVISFSTWWYFLNAWYAIDTFKKLFDEIKTFNPKYLDSNNNTLYFTLNDAWKIDKDFNKIVLKYKKEAEIEIKNKAIIQLEQQLKELKKE